MSEKAGLIVKINTTVCFLGNKITPLLVESAVTGRRSGDVTGSFKPAPEILRTNLYSMT